MTAKNKAIVPDAIPTAIPRADESMLDLKVETV